MVPGLNAVKKEFTALTDRRISEIDGSRLAPVLLGREAFNYLKEENAVT